MSETTKIEWADATFNPWVGCTKISPACDDCYAHTWARRAGHPELWEGLRRRTSATNWRQPHVWNEKAWAAGTRPRVFCASLADVFDNEIPVEWRADLFQLIYDTPHLDWLLLTKRIGNAMAMIEAAADYHFDRGDRNVAGWLTDWYKHGIAPENVWLGSTVVNQSEADRDISKLLATPARIHFLSIEPMLAPIDLRLTEKDSITTYISPDRVGLNWVIAGGESGGKARASNPAWFRSLRDQCAAAGTAFLFKQWGEWAPRCPNPGETRRKAELFVDGNTVWRVGKKNAGRELDGRTWDEFPEVA